MNLDDFSQQTNPIKRVKQWVAYASETTELREPLAMVLSTCGQHGPSSRTVLLKEVRPEGFVFYTNYLSHKGKDISTNPMVALCLFWDPIYRQISIQGRAEKLPYEEAAAYWRSRPRESQISQYISQQSEPVESREFLENRYNQVTKEFKDREIPCPEHWGGYLVHPEWIEFWCGRPFRLHDRFLYSRQDTTWRFQRLAP